MASARKATILMLAPERRESLETMARHKQTTMTAVLIEALDLLWKTEAEKLAESARIYRQESHAGSHTDEPQITVTEPLDYHPDPAATGLADAFSSLPIAKQEER